MLDITYFPIGKIVTHKDGLVLFLVQCNILGTPLHRSGQHSVQRLIDDSCAEAEVYSRLGLDSVLVENMNDLPYVVDSEVGPEICSTMAVICREVRKIFPAEKPVGEILVELQLFVNVTKVETRRIFFKEFRGCVGAFQPPLPGSNWTRLLELENMIPL